MNATTIIRILPLSTLIRALLREQAMHLGTMATRVVADPVQVRAWMSEAMPLTRYPAEMADTCRIMGVSVEEKRGARPEIIRAVPILEEGA